MSLRSLTVATSQDWIWRGLRVHYAFRRSPQPTGAVPVIFLHGFGAGWRHWRDNIPALAEERDVYAIDLVGFGDSEKGYLHYGPAFWSELVRDFCQQFVGSAAVLIGNSLGSVVAMVTAHRFPEQVHGLILLNLPDTSLLRSPAAHDRFKSLRQALLWALTPPWLIEPLLLWLRSPKRLKPWLALAYSDRDRIDADLLDLIARPARSEEAGPALRAMTRFNAEVPRDWRADRVLPQLSQPILLIWGESDRLVPFSLAKRCQQLNPQLDWLPMPATGHCPHDDRPAFVNQSLNNWLSQHDPADVKIKA
ncbi:alpha/beta fold hydrolase [Synechococcus elongatus]|uniref:alpha/beta fold hydrolase n=1 Tax=Synechococcus elongatus TaxID=32046 RepID=UPI000F7ED2CD|nr:alpha/beta fold hydrolase [Synechococcus elongatus]